MAELVDYKEFPLGDKNYWEVDRDLVQGGVGNEIGWNIEYEPVWTNEEKIAGWIPKIENVHGKRIEEVLAYLADNYEIIIDNNNSFDCLKPAEKRGLYDLYIDNHIDIPDTISKESPCYKQFMKEKEGK